MCIGPKTRFLIRRALIITGLGEDAKFAKNWHCRYMCKDRDIWKLKVSSLKWYHLCGHYYCREATRAVFAKAFYHISLWRNQLCCAPWITYVRPIWYLMSRWGLGPKVCMHHFGCGMNWIKGYYMIVKVKNETFWFSTYSMEMHSLTSSSFIICLWGEMFGSRTILLSFLDNLLQDAFYCFFYKKLSFKKIIFEIAHKTCSTWVWGTVHP